VSRSLASAPPVEERTTPHVVGEEPIALPAPRSHAPAMLTTAWLIARKDLAVELRTRSAFLAAAVFTVLAAAIFFYTWDPTAVSGLDLAPGVLWVIFTFSGMLGLNRSFSAELADRAIDGLLGAPISREAIFLGKALANLVFVLAVQVVAVPAVLLFYGVAIGLSGVLLLAAVTVLAAVGLVAVGTLFSAMAVNTRLAELLLPVITLPFLVPVVTAAAQATVTIMNGRSIENALAWVKILGAYDIVFVVACTLAYPFTIER
jgi:heme exporter protein B